MKQVCTASSGRAGTSCEVCQIGLNVPGSPLHLLVPAARVLTVDLSENRFQCLPGRDVWPRCRFLYDGRAGQIELEF